MEASILIIQIMSVYKTERAIAGSSSSIFAQHGDYDFAICARKMRIQME